MNVEARLSGGVGTSGLFDLGDTRAGRVDVRSPRVLVIDDDPSMRHMLSNYLEQHEMRVTLASQRQDVLRQFAASEPSLVILDLPLGHEDGLDLLREFARVLTCRLSSRQAIGPTRLIEWSGWNSVPMIM
jgi:PleD family two-component response regulator